MIKQSLAFDGILEKKYKILRTSIMLGNLKNREDTLREYEDTAKEIDKLKKNVYEELLASKMYTTTTLEDEKSRLKDLVTFIEKRVKERNDFVDDYIKITSNFLDGLDRVSLEDELDNYKKRYNNISEYLNNSSEINKLNSRLKELRDAGDMLAAYRLEQRTRYDMDMLRETGFCKGIENYSRVLSRRPAGSTPFTLLDYFPDDFVMFVDESHVTLPQVRGMSGGDFARKKNLVEYGFRLPSAFDNRPLFYDEFWEKVHQVVFVSATPGDYEKAEPPRQQYWVIGLLRTLENEGFTQRASVSKKWRLV